MGLVGLGKMGRHHLRCCGLASGIELTCVVDQDPTKASEVPPGIEFSSRLEDVLDRCEAIILATPSNLHEDMGLACLAAGKHLLVEKPLATSAAACYRLADAARNAGRTLVVGHVERWNAAVRALGSERRAVRYFESDRIASFDLRGTEVDVVMDLMIHDLDLLFSWVPEDAYSVDAVGVPIASDRIDLAQARLTFASGVVANLSASRVSRSASRKVRVFHRDSYASLDLGAQVAEVLQRDAAARPFGFTLSRIAPPEGHNPLVQELEAFARSVQGEDTPSADALQAARAVEAAEKILRSIEDRRRLWADLGETPVE